MKHPRSFLVVSAIVALLLAVLPACSGSAPASPTAAQTKAAAPAPAAPTTAPAAAAPAPVATAAPAPVAPTAAAAKVYEYNVAGSNDLSGPTAATARPSEPGRKAVFAWWNDTRGKELGVKLNLKTYDTRYDASVTASVWPGILSNDKPVGLLLEGGGDVTALSERLITDKVIGTGGITGNGFVWKPNQWVFYGQTTYVHQLMGFLNWTAASWKEGRPIRLAQIYAQNSASHKDMNDGTQSSLSKGVLGGKAEYVAGEALGLAAVDAANEVKRVLDKKPDYINLLQNIGPAVAVMTALQQYKATDVKVVFFSAAGIGTVARGMPLKDLEGAFETSSFASDAETDTEAFKIYQQYRAQVGGGDIEWVSQVAQGMVAALLVVRGVERVAKSAGADKITSAAVYDAMFTAPFSSKDLLGLAPDTTYTKDAPFPATNVKVRLSTVKDGKVKLATPDWVPVPEVPKW